MDKNRLNSITKLSQLNHKHFKTKLNYETKQNCFESSFTSPYCTQYLDLLH